MTPAPRLRAGLLGSLPADVGRPAGGARSGGIVHLGPGAFHRAHQATYLDDLRLAGLTTWSITAAGLRAPDGEVVEALAAQDHLYTVTTRDDRGSRTRVVDAIGRAVLGAVDPELVVQAIAEASTHVVSLTVTEGGYLVDGSGAYDPARHRAAVAAGPVAFDVIVEGLRRRRAAGLGPVTVLSCDNVVDNGAAARTSVLGVAAGSAPDLLGWIEDQVAFPCSMVDRITPATTPADGRWLQEQHHVADRAPVVAEPFRQWVLEDRFAGPRPPWEAAGVQLVADVGPWERMKLQVLNAGHLVLAYPAALRGIAAVAEAAADPVLARLLRAFHEQEAVPVVAPTVEDDVAAYAATVRDRFANPHLGDRVDRLCIDGTAKLPTFLVPTLADCLATGGPVRVGALVLAAWARYLLGRTDGGDPLDLAPDPHLDAAVAAARRAEADPVTFLDASSAVPAGLATDPRLRAAFDRAYRALRDRGVDGAVEVILSG